MKKSILLLFICFALGMTACTTTCDPSQPDCDGQGRGNNTEPT